MKKPSTFNISLLTLTLFALFTKPAHAYLNPGTGSVLFQFMIIGIAGGLFTVKTYWSSIKTFFSRFTQKKTATKNGKK
ncbi:MAG: hypothetical protein Q8P13_04150 [bacterium]|nr:hypothetical protein [bacterium]